MTCALCRKNEADKDNTHYLTDAIIKICINHDGGKERESGIYFDISSKNNSIEAGFQREATSKPALKEVLGREPTEEEGIQARQNPYSVDKVFCKECEDRFADIEKEFQAKHLPKLREKDLTGTTMISFKDCLNGRLFFLIQVWRTAACREEFKLSPKSKEDLRKIILKPVEAKLKEFPLSVTFLVNDGDQQNNTAGVIGFSSGANPYPIFMCDFIIQFYDSSKDLNYYPLFGLNDQKDFKKFINVNETEFIVEIVSGQRRRDFLDNYSKEVAKNIIKKCSKQFFERWLLVMGSPPLLAVRNQFENELVKVDDLPMAQWYSQERVEAFIKEFIERYLDT